MNFFAVSLASAVLIAAAGFLRRRDQVTDLTLAACFASYPMLLALMTWSTVLLRAQTIDLALYRADRAVGLDPFALIDLVGRTHWLNVLLYAAYQALPLMIAVAWIAERSTAMLRAIVIAPIAAVILYNLFPAVGPIHALARDTPHVLVSWKQIAEFPRNCFPSMHFGWALLVALNARRPVWKGMAWTFALLTAVATVGLGEHYYVDLIASVPFCLIVQSLATMRFPSRLATVTASPEAAMKD